MKRQQHHSLKRINRVAFLAILVGAVMLPTSLATAATDTVRLYVAPTSVSTTVGKTVTVQIRIDKNSPSRVDYVNTTLAFPVRLLNVTSITKAGSHFSDANGPTITYSNGSGTLSIRGTGSDLATQADVLVATVTFATRTSGIAALTFSNDSQVGNLLGGGNVKNYLTSKTAGNISIASPPPATTKSTQPTPTTPSPTPAASPAAPAETEPTANGIEPTEDDAPLTRESGTEAILASPTKPKSVAFVLSAFIGLGVLAAGAAWILLWSRRIEASTKLPVVAEPAPVTETLESDHAEAAILAAAARQDTDKHPSIHSVEAVQHHPVQPGAKLKPRSRPAAAPASQPTVAAAKPPAPVISPPVSKPAPAAEPPATPAASPPPQKPASTAASSLSAAQPEDMFEAGEKRLELEGLGPSSTPKAPAQPTSQGKL